MIVDASSRWIIQQIHQHATADSIWFSDENLLPFLADISPSKESPTLITNRWDICQHAKAQGIRAEFNDFDITSCAANSADHIFYRISKEKAVVHHIINSSLHLLKPNGTLRICGHKNEGIKTYIEKASARFECEKSIQKDGTNYFCTLVRSAAEGPHLPDENYADLRPSVQIGHDTVMSKPGQFGWNKIDEGSEYLVAQIQPILSELIAKQQHPFEHAIDLGCGYGYLTIATKNLPIVRRTLTDNNAAALLTAAFNCNQLNINAEVVASDAGSHLTATAELIFCNPPFHQGFSIDGDLTDRFLQNTARLLRDDGTAFFVVNQFIPLEKKAEALFKSVKLIATNKRFKVIELKKG